MSFIIRQVKGNFFVNSNIKIIGYSLFLHQILYFNLLNNFRFLRIKIKLVENTPLVVCRLYEFYRSKGVVMTYNSLLERFNVTIFIS